MIKLKAISKISTPSLRPVQMSEDVKRASQSSSTQTLTRATKTSSNNLKTLPAMSRPLGLAKRRGERVLSTSPFKANSKILVSLQALH